MSVSAYPKSSGAIGANLRVAVLSVLVAVSLAVVSCDEPASKAPPVSPDTVSVVAPLDSAVDSLTASTYDAALGDVLLVPLPAEGNLGDAVALLSPRLPIETPVGDTIGLRERLGDGRVELFARGGLVGQRVARWDAATVSASACAAWPVARFSAAEDLPAADPGVRRWLVALPAGRVRSIPLDSIEALGSRDSAALAATLARLASGLPEDSSSAFRGLPFTVVRAYRSTDRSSAGFVAGVLVRRIPQEDRPLEERLLMVVAAPNENMKQWTAVWHERASGREEEVIATEPLAALSVGESAPYTLLVLGRDDGSGTALAMLERRGTRWRIRWESPVTGC